MGLRSNRIRGSQASILIQLHGLNCQNSVAFAPISPVKFVNTLTSSLPIGGGQQIALLYSLAHVS